MRRCRFPATVLLLALVLIPLTSLALPKRLIVLVDGVSYRDLKALQDGLTYTNRHGKVISSRAFNDGYFPVSRLISTFPSISDPAWTEILGARPLPGYQRTYFNAAANREISLNGITSLVEYEQLMSSQNSGNWRRTLDYVLPMKAYKYEVSELVKNFLGCQSDADSYYVLIHTTDSAQHLSGDIFAMLSILDRNLQEIRAAYRTREHRELEILIVSDHGNDHSGSGSRVAIRSFLKKSGYQITTSLVNPRDVVLPTAGIESWVEVHNFPDETERLVQLLRHLEGVDLVTARSPTQTNRFIVVRSSGERASIDWNPVANSFRYSAEKGDPIDYLPIVRILSEKHQLDPSGFAPADAWMAETLTHRYPMALERIARGHSSVTLNPATILLSLTNGYVHCDWLIKRGEVLATAGGTHGALDHLSSTGILLSNFAPTEDTSTSRVAARYVGFSGLRDYRALESGAEWSFCRNGIGTTNNSIELRHVDGLALRLWTPDLAPLNSNVNVKVSIMKVPRFQPASFPRGFSTPPKPAVKTWTLSTSSAVIDARPHDRTFAFPTDLRLEPLKTYQLNWRIADPKKNYPTHRSMFYTDNRGQPISY